MSLSTSLLHVRGFVAASQYRVGSLLNKVRGAVPASSQLQHVISVAAKPNKCADFYHEEELRMQKSLTNLVERKLLKNPKTFRQMMTSEDYNKRVFHDLPDCTFKEKLLTKDQLVPKGFLRKSSNIYEYELKGDLSPSDALESFIEGPTVVDTAVAAEAVFLKVIKDGIKEDRFNAIFSRNNFPLEILQGNSLSVNSPVNLFTQTCLDMQPGMRCYFAGVPFYYAKHLNGDGMGIYGIMIQKKPNESSLYWFAGLDNLKTAEEIDAYLVKRYNSKPEVSIISKLMSGLSDEQRLDKFKEDIPTEYHTYFKKALELQFPLLSMEDARMLNIGFSGSQHADKISLEIIDYVNSCSIKTIQSEGFIDQLRIKNIGLHLKGLNQISRSEALTALFSKKIS